MDFNKVILKGNLTKDPELRYTPAGQAVCDFSIAINKQYTGKDGKVVKSVSYIGITAWAKLAESVAEYCKKGVPVLVEGSLEQEQWETKEGEKRSKTKVVASQIIFLGTGKGKTQGEVDKIVEHLAPDPDKAKLVIDSESDKF